MTDRARLTEAFVRSRICPPDRSNVTFLDTGGNLILWVSKRTKAFRYRYRFNGGKTTELTLGRWPVMSVEKARELAASYDRARSEGRDPKHAIFRPRDVPTVGEVLDLHLASKEGESKRSVTALYKDLRSAYGATTLIDFTGPMLRDWMLKAYPHRPGSARTLIKNLTGAFSLAMDPHSGLLMPPNFRNPASRMASRLPFLSLPENRPGSYSTVYEEEEMKALLGAIARAYEAPAISTVAVLALELMLLTGARPTEIKSLRWDEIEIVPEGRVIVKDRHKTWKKTGRPRRVLLMGGALDVLERAKKLQVRRASPYVFPSNVNRAGQKVHHVDFLAPTCAQIGRLADMKFVPYNFRSAYINFALDVLGFENIELVAENVGHTDVQTTLGFYRKLKDSRLTGAASKVAEAFARLRTA